MARGLSRGEIWMFRFQTPDKTRPVLILSRQGVIALLHTVLVAPITTTAHGIRSEVGVGIAEGLKQPSVVNLDHVQTVRKDALTRYVGRLDPAKMRDICRALAIATGCDA